jgi:hypothetical protein
MNDGYNGYDYVKTISLQPKSSYIEEMKRKEK